MSDTNQNLEATLFDVPEVAAIARERLASDPLTKKKDPLTTLL
jgi:hypothetical protein